jgi:small subunit ribosomal protein S20
MPQHKSAEKRMLTNERDRKRNRGVKSQVRRALGDLKESIGGPDAAAQLSSAHSVLDKASKKGVLHPRRVDRMKSRLARAVHRATA